LNKRITDQATYLFIPYLYIYY